MHPDFRSPIGIIDSGMGGISIRTALVRAMPHEETIYWADTAHCPYGGKARKEIVQLVRAGVETLLTEGVKIIVVACNTATTAAIATLREEWPEMPFVGLEPAVKPAAETTRSGIIGVLGTEFTVRSEMFRTTARRYASGVRVIPVAGNGLVEAVEQGLEEAPETERLLRGYIEPLLAAGADRLVLACTHFPLLAPQIERIINGRDMRLIDPAEAIARHTKEILATSGLLYEPDGATTEAPTHHFISTGGTEAAERLQLRAEQYAARLRKR
ncbi:glutamate racemase [uncultured Rikenella sp.]|uniref:glutamate racemase n=1 Tax=uncultured Rikenella sp. TaxID=368003 RepID=UPI00272B6088|nr:glutamate racemase [uncultured Rikenella sp.]